MSKQYLWCTVLAVLAGSGWSASVFAQVLVFECKFPESFSFYVTVYDDGSPARIGREQGVGDFAQTYFDKATGAWVVVEFVDHGKLPSTLTTILPNGNVWHSRHTLGMDGTIVPSQQSGTCDRNSIN